MGVRGLLVAWWEAALDLAWGSACAVCGRPGRALCRACAATLASRPRLSWPTPRPPGLVPPHASSEYAGAVRLLVLAHKEHRRLALAAPLGRLLADAVTHCLVESPSRPVVLVPIPSHPTVVRSRGHDPVLALARVAASELRRRGQHASVVRALRVASRPADQAGLSAGERAANLEGRFVVRPRALDRLDRLTPGVTVVVVDDVLTTGATLREAQRALETAGTCPGAAAVVAASRLRRQGRQGRQGRSRGRGEPPDSGSSVPNVHPGYRRYGSGD